MSHITRAQARQLIGREVFVLRRDGTAMHGKLTRLQGDNLMMTAADEKAHTQAIVPLALFDVLAIGTAPFAYGGGFGRFGGFGGFGGVGGFGRGGVGGFGFPFFW